MNAMYQECREGISLHLDLRIRIGWSKVTVTSHNRFLAQLKNGYANYDKSLREVMDVNCSFVIVTGWGRHTAVRWEFQILDGSLCGLVVFGLNTALVTAVQFKKNLIRAIVVKC